MKRYKRNFLLCLLIVAVLIAGCLSITTKIKNYEEIPSMLNVLTNKVQIAVEDGYLNKGGEQAVFEYIGKKNPDVLNWFKTREYELSIGVVDIYAVVIVCDDGKPVFEDTYCDPGHPDKDYTNNPNVKSCEITMTIEEVKEICQ